MTKNHVKEIFSKMLIVCIILKYLFSAGSGEIITWNIDSSEIIWKMRVGNVLFSGLAWLTKDVLLASLTNGVVLKCDTTL